MTKDGKPRARIETLGCRVNQYESAAVAAALEKVGFVLPEDDGPCDVCIVNTCAVTGESERKSRQFIRRAASRNPKAGVIVLGCYSQLRSEEVKALPQVIGVLGNRNKLRAAEIARDFIAARKENGFYDRSPVVSVCDVETAPMETMHITHTENARAFVKIEDGCDNRCAYCIIKKARGSVVSRPMREVIAEVRDLTASGYREIVLTGIETASYGKDLNGEDLASLIEAVAKVEGVERIRLGSLEPSHVTPAFLSRVSACPKFMPSFHLSLQSGSSTVLARMRRRYNAEQAMSCVQNVRRFMPRATLTCDIIVGFPGETEEEFEETLAFARRADFLHMHIFPFSARKGTEAATMAGQLQADVKGDRAARLSALGDELSNRSYRARVGETASVLFETYENGINRGHTEDMMEAILAGEDLHGRIVAVRAVSYENKTLLCETI